MKAIGGEYRAKHGSKKKGSTMDWEALLLDRLRAGDARAFEALVRPYDGRMRAIARRFLSCDEDSADAVQDALLMAYRSIDSFRGHSKFWTWLYRVLVNVCLTLRRSRSRRRGVSLEDLPHGVADSGRLVLSGPRWTEPPYTGAERAETQALIRASIEHLPKHYREVLLLRDIEELDTDHTAQRLGTSRSAVKTRLHRARQALRALLEPMLRMQA